MKGIKKEKIKYMRAVAELDKTYKQQYIILF